MESIAELQNLSTELSLRYEQSYTKFSNLNTTLIQNQIYKPTSLNKNRIISSKYDGKIDSSSDISITQLEYLSGLKQDFNTQINELYSKANNSLIKWKKESRKISNRLENEWALIDSRKDIKKWSLDNISQGIVNKYIINNEYTALNNFTVNGTVSAKSIRYLGTNQNISSRLSYSSSVTINTESLYITNESENTSLKIIKNDSNQNNIIEMYSAATTPVFVMNSEGYIGIGTSLPTAELDINGNIKITGTLNDISAKEINYLANVNNNIQDQINNAKNIIEDGVVSAQQILPTLFTNIEDLLNRTSNQMYDIINPAYSESYDILTNTCNQYITSKQNKLNFDNSLSYDPDTRILSVSKSKNVWAINSNVNTGEEYISYKNINIYNDKIERVVHQVNDDTIKLFTPPIDALLSDESGVIKTINNTTYANGNYEIEWSSSRYFANGDKYNPPSFWFNGNSDTGSYGFMSTSSYDNNGIYIGANRIVDNYKGDWVIIGLPNSIRLNNFILQRSSDINNNAPIDMRLYGSYDNNNWDILYQNDNIIYNNNIYDSSVIDNINAYKYFAFCFNKISTNGTIRSLILSNIYIYGKLATTDIQQYVLSEDVDLKHDIMTGAISTVIDSNLPINRILISDNDGKITTSSIDSQVLSYIDTLSSPIQQQFDNLNTQLNDLLLTSNITLNNLNAAEQNILSYIENASNQIYSKYVDKQQVLTFGNGLSYDTDTKIISISEYISQQSSQTENTNIDSNSVASLYWNVSNINQTGEINYGNVLVGSNYITINGNSVVFEDELVKKQDIINYSTGLIYDKNTDNVSLDSYIWENKGAYIKYNNIHVYNNKLVIGENIIDDDIKFPPKPLPNIASTNVSPFYISINDRVFNKSYGNGPYSISWSSADANQPASFLFDNNTSTIYSISGTYNSSGIYTGDKYILPDYQGEWINIILPDYIYLSYVKLTGNINAANDAPGDYKIYGYDIYNNDWTELIHEKNPIYDNNINISERCYPEKSYKKYGIVINKLKGSSTKLSFSGFDLYGTIDTKLFTEFYNSTTDMLAWYKFDGNVNDSSDNGYDATIYGTPTFISSDTISFNNHDDYIVIPTDTIKINGITRENITISMWVKKTESSTNNCQYFSIDDGVSTLTNTIFFGQSSSNSNAFHVRYGTTYVNITTNYDNRELYSWNHYVFVLRKDGNNANIKFYINNTEYIAFDSNVSWIEIANLVKINRWIDNSYNSIHINKDIKDFRIYNRVLSHNEIFAIYNYNFYTSTTDMIAWYKFDGDFTDSSGNGYDMINTNCVINNTDKVNGTGCLDLTTNDTNYLTNTSSYNYGSDSSITFCVWFKIFSYPTVSGDTSQRILTISPDSGENNRTIIEACRKLENDNITLTTSASSTNYFFVINYKPALNTWIHLSFVLEKNPLTALCYINGVLYDSTTSSSYVRYPALSSQYHTTIGTNYAKESNHSDCFIDDLRIYNRKLTAEEIFAIYSVPNYDKTSRFLTNNTHLQLWYPFTGKYGNIDMSSKNKNAIVSGTPNIKNNAIMITKDNYLAVPSDVIDFNNDITISFWYRFDDNNESARLFDFAKTFGTQGYNNCIQVQRDRATSTLIFYMDGNSRSVDFGHETSGSLIHLTWIIKKTEEWFIYKNSVLIDTRNIAYPIPNKYNSSYIGKSNYNLTEFNMEFKMTIKDFRIYNKKLNQSEIDDIYKENAPISGYLEVRTLKTDNILKDNTYNKVNIGQHVEILKTNNTTSTLTSRIINFESDNISSDYLPYHVHIKKDLWMDGGNLIWTSDSRIKKNIRDIDDDSALEKILAIEPKTYKYIDHTKKGYDKVYGFVSHQIENVFPHATKKTSRYIPNIFQICRYNSNNNEIILPQDFDITKLNVLYTDKYTSNIESIYDENNEVISSNIVVINQNHISNTVRISLTNIPDNYIDVYFQLSSNESGYSMRLLQNIDILHNNSICEIFVYGTKINDLTTIDKSYIYTLNTCATQVLNRKINNLEKENSELQTYINSLEKRITTVKNFFNK